MRGSLAESAPISGKLQVELAAERRVRDGVWRLPQFKAHGDARLFKQRVAVLELLQVLPYEQVERGVLGPEACREVPSARERRSLVEMRLAARAGPTGSNAKDAALAWRQLEQAAQSKMGARGCCLPVERSAPTSCGWRACVRPAPLKDRAVAPRAQIGCAKGCCTLGACAAPRRRRRGCAG